MTTKRHSHALETPADDAARFSELVSMLTHEMKTPLASICASSEALLSDLALSPEQKHRFLEIIHEEARRLTRMVKDLGFASRDAGGDPLAIERRIFDLEAVVRDSVMVFEPLTNELEVKIECVLAGRDPRLRRCTGDPDRVKQVMENLIGNALKYAPPGSTVTVKADTFNMSVERVARPVARVMVADRGPGIDPKHHMTIFEKYRRVTREGYKKDGLGLGLYISKRIVEAHGGSIWAANNPEGGAVFTWTLPL